MAKPLNPKQQIFVAEYIKSKNATQAAIAAGYSKKNARFNGSQLLTNPNIRAAVDAGISRQAKRIEISADRVLQRIAEIAFDREYVHPATILKATEQLGKHLKLFTELHEHQVEAQATIVHATPEQIREELAKLEEEC